jgi:hypothetical protein
MRFAPSLFPGHGPRARRQHRLLCLLKSLPRLQPPVPFHKTDRKLRLQIIPGG